MFHNVTDRYWGNVTLYGYDQTLNLWWWTDGTNYYISAAPGIPITVDSGANCNPSGFLYNSQPYYTVSGGWWWYDSRTGKWLSYAGCYLWYDSSMGKWVISAALGYKTAESQVDGTWYGDVWWSSSSLVGSYTARGIGYGGTAKTVALGKVVGWKSTSKFGVYTPETGSGLTGNKYAGWLKLTDNLGFTFWEQSTQYNDKSTYKLTFTSEAYGNEIWFDGENWILSSAKGVKDYTEPIVYPEWIPGQLYAVGDCVTYNGTAYKCWLDLSRFPTSFLNDLEWGWNMTYQTCKGYWSCATLAGTYSLVWPYSPPTPAPTYTRPWPENRTITGPQYSGTNSSGTLDQSTQLIAQVAQWLA